MLLKSTDPNSYEIYQKLSKIIFFGKINDKKIKYYMFTDEGFIFLEKASFQKLLKVLYVFLEVEQEDDEMIYLNTDYIINIEKVEDRVKKDKKYNDTTGYRLMVYRDFPSIRITEKSYEELKKILNK